MFKIVACRRDEVEPEKLKMGDTTLKSGWMNSTAFAVLAVFGAGAVPAMAQQAAAKVAAADARNDGIADIVVTATRRSQNLQDVPIAVQALSGDTLRQLGVANFDKLIEFLPNVRTGGRGPGQSQIYIRGLSTDTQSILVAGSAGVNPNVALYLDDAPVSAPAANVVPMSRPAAPADTGARVKLGDINASIAPLSITADGLAQLGFAHVATEKAAKLYRTADLPRIYAAMVAHIEAAQAKQAA